MIILKKTKNSTTNQDGLILLFEIQILTMCR